MGVPFIEIRNVSKSFNGNKVLDNVSLTIDEGERVGVIGKSGSGKTVLLSMLKGIREYKPESGHVIFHVAVCEHCQTVEGPSWAKKRCPHCCPHCLKEMEMADVDIYGEDPKSKWLRQRIAIMFQRTFALYGSLTVYENLVEALSKVSSEDATKKALEIAKDIGLANRLLHAARDLSGGEKQRVVLGRQLAIKPLLLLADEPTGTLDPLNADMIHRIIKRETGPGKSTLIVTSHLPGAIEELCEKAVLLEDGKISLMGNPHEVATKFLSRLVPEEIPKPPQLGDVVLRVKDLKKYYFSIDKGVVKALDGVTFEVREREIFGIIGLSGAGKTTLSRAIVGVTQPTSGTIELKIGDEWVNMLEPGPTGRGRATPFIGLLHQEYALYPHRTVQENLTDAIGLELPDEFARFKAQSVLTAAGFDEATIERTLSKYPDELSEGERHRVALAQVLIKEPIIVLLDEPSGTMDPITQQDVAKSIKNARNELGQTFVIISHDMGFVENTCDDAILMRNGKVVGRGKPSDVAKELTPEEKDELMSSKNGLP
ncbi:MAG: methyl coenzyme M reductase system, component A2 [Candidatus Methanosuratincola sp.]|uniref:Methyl coenzyme M reductase system component A2 n=1 Tax=Methanosuratincola subterraneus TaxID=2593994 RepID=A0A3S3VCX6_METS7|nr:MAG: Methyl coenzyme M reductase system component A2 [Candidatus Methanosuratincola subterraneus]